MRASLSAERAALNVRAVLKPRVVRPARTPLPLPCADWKAPRAIAWDCLGVNKEHPGVKFLDGTLTAKSVKEVAAIFTEKNPSYDLAYAAPQSPHVRAEVKWPHVAAITLFRHPDIDSVLKSISKPSK